RRPLPPPLPRLLPYTTLFRSLLSPAGRAFRLAAADIEHRLLSFAVIDLIFHRQMAVITVLAAAVPDDLVAFHHHLFHDAAACAQDRKSTRLNSSHVSISYAVF